MFQVAVEERERRRSSGSKSLEEVYEFTSLRLRGPIKRQDRRVLRKAGGGAALRGSPSRQSPSPSSLQLKGKRQKKIGIEES